MGRNGPTSPKLGSLHITFNINMTKIIEKEDATTPGMGDRGCIGSRGAQIAI